jgi:aspartyl-tRNA(Asn)/glutamyl-tRNA(Gln) amidotransferase subunit C
LLQTPSDIDPADRFADEMKVMDLADLAQLAELARLRAIETTDGDRGRHLGAQIADLLAHFAVLGEVDTEGVEPSAYPLPIPHRTRPDRPQPPLPVDEVLGNAPRRRAGCFLVPRVVEG